MDGAISSQSNEKEYFGGLTTKTKNTKKFASIAFGKSQKEDLPMLGNHLLFQYAFIPI
ncbi:MAG: hypothetical protein JKY09_07225 [Crocinitomicaceae bacterium]|nr:hypothetical protein [Crocinitomicaceae bacterium]